MKFYRLLFLVLFVGKIFSVSEFEDKDIMANSLASLNTDFTSHVVLRNETEQTFVVKEVKLPVELYFYEVATIPKVGDVIKKGDFFSASFPLKKGSKMFLYQNVFTLESEDKRSIMITLALETDSGEQAALSAYSKGFHINQHYNHQLNASFFDGIVTDLQERVGEHQNNNGLIDNPNCLIF